MKKASGRPAIRAALAMVLWAMSGACAAERGASRHVKIFAQSDRAHTLVGNADACKMQEEPDEIWIQKDHVHDLSIVPMEKRGDLDVQTLNPAVATVERTATGYTIIGRGLGVSDLQVVHKTPAHAFPDTTMLPVRGISKRVTVVAWINADDIDLEAIAPNPSRRLQSMLASPTQCLFLMNQWSKTGDRLEPYAIDKPEDALYAKAYLVKASGNERPDKTLPPNYIGDEDYKLLNQLQTTASAAGELEEIGMSRWARIGRTKDPCGLVPEEAAKYPVLTLAGEEHELNGDFTRLDGAAAVQINQARISPLAQEVEWRLTDSRRRRGEVTPWIYSGIRFDKTGGYKVCTQMFPTYSIYEDGKLVEERKQSNLADFLKLDHTSQTSPSICQ